MSSRKQEHARATTRNCGVYLVDLERKWILLNFVARKFKGKWDDICQYLSLLSLLSMCVGVSVFECVRIRVSEFCACVCACVCAFMEW